MPMLAGSAGVNGLANELYIALNVQFPIPDIEGVPQTQVDDERKQWCNVIASTVILHITTNATVNTITSTPGAQAGPSTLPGIGTGGVS